MYTAHDCASYYRTMQTPLFGGFGGTAFDDRAECLTLEGTRHSPFATDETSTLFSRLTSYQMEARTPLLDAVAMEAPSLPSSSRTEKKSSVYPARAARAKSSICLGASSPITGICRQFQP